MRSTMKEWIPFADCFTAGPEGPTPLVFLGIADDTQSSFLRGSADGPEVIRRSYDGRCFNATTETGVDLTKTVVDLGDLSPLSSWEESVAAYRARIEKSVKKGETPFVAGGDHAITVPVVQGLRSLGEPIHIIQVDAHPDLYPEFDGNPDSHACTGARLLEMEHVASLTQLGVRTMNDQQRKVAETYADRLRIVQARHLPTELARLEHIPDGAPVYVTIDMDGLDPAYAPGVSHPVPGGLSARQALSLLQQGHWALVGMDVTEVNPARDPQNQTAILAGRLLHEGMGYAFRTRRADASR